MLSKQSYYPLKFVVVFFFLVFNIPVDPCLIFLLALRPICICRMLNPQVILVISISALPLTDNTGTE